MHIVALLSQSSNGIAHWKFCLKRQDPGEPRVLKHSPGCLTGAEITGDGQFSRAEMGSPPAETYKPCTFSEGYRRLTTSGPYIGKVVLMAGSISGKDESLSQTCESVRTSKRLAQKLRQHLWNHCVRGVPLPCIRLSCAERVVK